MRPTGGVFFREGDGIDAKKLVAKVCDGGRIITDDPRTATGTERVAFAVHAPRGTFWAVVDSAEGALGIAKGEWSNVALAANHLRTDAIWYRTYAIDLALAVYFPHGGTWMRAYVGIADDVINRLDADRVPVHESQPPATATEALLACVAYDPGTYETGPDAAVARRLLAIHEALVAGDAAALRARFDEIADAERSLALAILRGADRGEWRACIEQSARQIAAPKLRVDLRGITFDEEILRRAGELAQTEAELTPVLDQLDAIERDAGTRSSHSHPAGVAMLAYALGKRGAQELVLACELRLLRRKDPAWYTCNNVLGTLLKRTPFTLDAPAREAIRIVEARLPELGQSAIDSITYNLACVFARAGDLERAMVELRRCETPRQQNAHPERDTDLEPLWSNAEFQALISPPAPPPPEIVLEPEPPYDVPPEHAVPRFELDFTDRPDADGTLIDRLGGRPNAPSSEFPWPSSSSRPMSMIVQVVGKAGGGTVELGDIHVLQVFADMEGDYYETSEHAVVAHRAPCVAVVEPPVTVELSEVRAITLTPGFDDRRLLDDDFESDAARTHVWCDKIFGVPVGANLDPDLRDAADEPMRLILELVTIDDYFLWALFANQQLTVFRLEVVRG